MKKILTAVMFAAIVLSGCSKSETTLSSSSEGYGTLRLSVSENGDLTVKSEDTTTDFSDYKVVFTKPSDSSYSLEYTYAEITENNGEVELAPGKYSVTVTSPNTEDVAWEQPIYSGSNDFTIVAGAISEASTVCTIQNIKVTVDLTSAFTNEFKDYNVIVSGTYDGEEKSLTYTPDIIAAGTAGWFKNTPTQTLSIDIRGTRSTGETMQQTGTISQTEAADHHTIEIDAVGTGSATITISIDNSMNESTTEITVPGFDETPVEDDDDTTSGSGDDSGDTGDDNTGSDEGDTSSSTAPYIVWEANPDFEDTYLAQTMDVNLMVYAPEGIKTFIVYVESDDLASALTGMVGSTTLDLIDDPTTVSTMSNLGLTTGDNLKGKTEVEFSLSTLVPMILLYEPAAGSKHVFTLELTDNAGQSLSQSLTFVMPE